MHKNRNKAKRNNQAGYLFNHIALAKVLRAKVLDTVKREGHALPATWVVDRGSVGTNETAVIYIGRYLYRGLVPSTNFTACRTGTFRYPSRYAKQWAFRMVPDTTLL